MKNLPNEVLMQVIDHFKDNKKVLKKISTVNQFFHDVARIHLFKRVALRTSLEDTIARVQAISQPQLARYVKEVRLEVAASTPEKRLPVKNISPRKLHHITEEEFNSFQQCINILFAATRQTVLSIDVWTGLDVPYFSILGLCDLEERMVLFIIAVRISLCVNDMVALRSLSACILQGGMFEPMLRDSTNDRMKFLGKKATGDDHPVCSKHWRIFPDDLRLSRLKKNLQRVTNFEMETKFDIRDRNLDPSEFLLLISKRMPNLRGIHLYVKAERYQNCDNMPFNLNTFSAFSLRKLSLQFITLTHFSNLLISSQSSWNLNYLSLRCVFLPINLEERWSALFEILKVFPIREFCIERATYFLRTGGFVYRGPAHEKWTTEALCTGYLSDIDALESLVTNIQTNGGTVTVYGSKLNERRTLEKGEKPLYCFHDKDEEVVSDDEQSWRDDEEDDEDD